VAPSIRPDKLDGATTFRANGMLVDDDAASAAQERPDAACDTPAQRDAIAHRLVPDLA
jgi:hypothetical protein